MCLQFLHHMCLLYIDKIVFSTYHFIYTSCKHCGIFTQIHCLGPIQIQSYCFFFSPAPPLNVLQFCFAAQRGKIEKNSSNSLSHLSRSNNSTSRHMGFGFQFFCSIDLQGALLCWLGAGGSSYPRCAALHHHCFTEQPSFAGALLPALHQVECRSLACILWPNLPQVGFHLTKPRLFKDPSTVPELCTDTRQPPAGPELWEITSTRDSTYHGEGHLWFKAQLPISICR